MSQMHKLVLDLRLNDMSKWKVDLTYCLGNRHLGEYNIQCCYPNTIQLTRPNSDHPIWIPNPINSPSSIEYSGDDDAGSPLFRVYLFENGIAIYKAIFHY